MKQNFESQVPIIESREGVSSIERVQNERFKWVRGLKPTVFAFLASLAPMTAAAQQQVSSSNEHVISVDIPKPYEVSVSTYEYGAYPKTEMGRLMVLFPNEHDRIRIFVRSDDERWRTYVMDDAVFPILCEINKLFPITPDDMMGLDPDDINNIRDMLQNVDLRARLDTIIAHQDPGTICTLASLPIDNPNVLLDDDYFTGRVRVGELGINMSNRMYEKQVFELGEKDKLFEVLKNYRQTGVFLDANLLSHDSSELTSKLELNKDILCLAEGEVVGDDFLIDISYVKFDATGEHSVWNDLAISHVDAVNLYKENGFGVVSLVQLHRSEAKILLDHPQEIAPIIRLLCEKVVPILSSEDISKTDIVSFVGKLVLQFDLTRDEGRVKAFAAIQKIESSMTTAEAFFCLYENGFNASIVQPLLQKTNRWQRNLDKFFEDPALDILVKFDYQNNPPDFLDTIPEARDRAEWLMRAARSLYIAKGTNCTEEDFKNEFLKLLDLRLDKSLMDTKLFSKRNIAVFAHNEKWEGDSTHVLVDRFGTPAVMEGLADEKPKDVKMFKGQQTVESLQTVKDGFLDYVRTHDNITILVDAHGGPDAIYFSNGVPDESGKIITNDSTIRVTYGELADAIVYRAQHGHNDQVILIMSSCFNQNFIRSLYEDIRKKSEALGITVALPIAAGTAEFGQYSFSDNIPYGTTLFKDLLSPKRPATLKDLLLIEKQNPKKSFDENIISNISIFVPVEENGKELEHQIGKGEVVEGEDRV